MMTEICEYLRNWFDRDQAKITDVFTVSGGEVRKSTGEEIGLVSGQYFRIFGSPLNNGVWRYPEEETSVRLRDETFTGTIWLMAVPPMVEEISRQVDEWKAKYDTLDSPSMSPYNSESFAGYSYSKGGNSGGSAVDYGGGWQSVFGGRLRPWKKI